MDSAGSRNIDTLEYLLTKRTGAMKTEMTENEKSLTAPTALLTSMAFVIFHTLPLRTHSHAFSPCIVAMTFRRCFPSRNSKNHIPCHVPNANRPSVIGIETLAPISEDLICAFVYTLSAQTLQSPRTKTKKQKQQHTGISSLPSAS